MFELKDDQVARFHRDGLLLVERGLIDDATVDLLRERYERLFRGEFETGVAPDEVNWQEGKSDPTLSRQICNGWKADRLVASVIFRADLGRAIARLAGWSGARVMIDNVIWKPAGTRPLGFHQDNAYQHWHIPGELVSCWIALDDTTAEGGTMELVRGSHRWHRSLPEGEFHGPKNYRAPMEKAAAREGVTPEIVPVVVKKGGGSFHHGWTWHGSGDNSSAAPRRSLVLHAMPADVRYATDPRDLVHGVGGIYSRYKRLNSDVIDENYFPIIWREDGYRTPGLEEHCRGGWENS